MAICTKRKKIFVSKGIRSTPPGRRVMFDTIDRCFKVVDSPILTSICKKRRKKIRLPVAYRRDKRKRFGKRAMKPCSMMSSLTVTPFILGVATGALVVFITKGR